MQTPVSTPTRVRPWASYPSAEQAGVLLDLAQLDTIGGLATHSTNLRHPYAYLRLYARNIAGHLQAEQPAGTPSWRWADLTAAQQRRMLREIAEWSLHQWAARRDQPAELRQQHRGLSLKVFTVLQQLQPQRGTRSR